ncbi:MAG: hypothetical protein ACOY46_08890 [Bacillota bacterium]
MNNFPDFMRNPQNVIASKSQSRGTEGYVYDGADGSQMAHWKCYNESTIHAFGGKRAEREVSAVR